mmetsp:Transcript_37134/g.88286  ORF Transcript_37134/g.88286 Transcript_37134/m.88286 type:complete len:93 (-) Transcript_37134:243-521(-)
MSRAPPSTAKSSAPPFEELVIPSRGSSTPASQCSYPSTPNFSCSGSSCTAEVMQKLQQLEEELQRERQLRSQMEAEISHMAGRRAPCKTGKG